MRQSYSKPKVRRFLRHGVCRYYCDVAYTIVLFNYYSALDKYMPFVCMYACFFLFSFLVKSFSIVYFVVFTVVTICGE